MQREVSGGCAAGGAGSPGRFDASAADAVLSGRCDRRGLCRASIRRHLRAGAALFPLLLTASPAFADDWNGGIGDWFDDGNWADGSTPTGGDTVSIDAGEAQVGAPGAVSNDLWVGESGTGSLTISGGGTLATDDVSIGVFDGSNGTAAVTGPGSSWSAGVFLSVGNGGVGTLTISDGGSVSNLVGVVGNLTTGDGTVTVTGSGSTWTTTNGVGVGVAGTGSLTISNGGTVQGANSEIGGMDGGGNRGTGTVLVDGSGSSFTNTGALYVGRGGNGTLTVSGGGAVGNADGVVGTLSGGIGTATVTGSGSLWASSGSLTVGGAGSGTLDILDGGLVSAGGGLTLAADSGSVGTLNIGDGGAAGILDVATITGGAGAATLNFDHSEAAYFFSRDGTAGGGAIAVTGSVALNHLGSGTTVLTGSNSYSGGTTISAGTLQIGSGGTTGSITGNVANDGTLAFDRSDTLAFDGAITGTGAVRQQGSGTTVLTGDSTYSGGTTISAGTLQIGDGGASGSIVGDVVNDGTLVFDRSGTPGFGGAISGSGALVKAGSGTLTLTGAHSYTGATTVGAGTLRLEGGDDRLSAATAVTVASGATLAFDDGNQRAGSLAGAGTVESELVLGVYGGTLTIGTDDSSTAFSGTLLVGTVNKAGTGTQTLSGTHAVRTLGIFGGTVRIGAGGWEGVGGTLPNVAMFGGTILDLDGQALSIGTISDAFGTATVQLGAGGVLTIADGSTTFNGEIAGSGTVVKQGAATFTLNGESSFTGLLDVQAGTLRLGASGGLADGLAVNVETGAVFDLDGRSDTIASLAGSGGVTLGGAILTLDQDSDTSYGGQLSGGGGLAKQGSGVLTLAGTSAGYTGTTTIAAGTLRVNGAIAGSAVTVNPGGTLGGAGTVGTTLVASGGRLAPGSSVGTLTVAGDLTLNSGSSLDFELGAPGSRSNPATGVSDRVAVSGNLVLDGTVNLSQSDDPTDGTAGVGYYRLMTYGGTLTDNGLAIGAVPGGFAAGDFTITAGGGKVDLFIAAAGDDTLQDWHGGDGAWTDTNWVNQGGSRPVAWTGNHAVFQGSPGGTIAVTGSPGFKGLQFVDEGYRLAGEGQLVIDGSEAADGNAEIRVLAESAEIATAIVGTGGLTKTGEGTLILNGVSSYTGETSVLAGTLAIGDESHPGASLAGDVRVGASGSLIGHGTIAGDLFNSAGGLVSPGGSIGRLTVGGDYAQGADSTLSIEVSPTEASRLVVGGTASLDGTLRLVFQPGVYEAADFTLVEAGDVEGEFASVEGTNPSGLAQTIAYEGSDVLLQLGGGSFAVAPSNGAIVATSNTAALQGAQQAAGLLLGRLAGGPGGGGDTDLRASLAGTQPTQLAFDGGTDVSGLLAQAPAALAGIGGWFRAYGSLASLTGEGATPGFDMEGGGFLAGAEQEFGEAFHAGLAAGYGHSQVWQDGGKSTLDTPRLALYGGWEQDDILLGGMLGYAHHFIESERPIEATGETARSEHGADELSAAAQAGYRLRLEGFTVTPRAGLLYVRLFEEGYGESGAPGFELEVEDRQSDSLRPFLGLSASRSFTTDEGLVIVPTLDLGYSRELLDAAPSSTVQVGGGSFLVEGLRPSRDQLTVGGSLGLQLSDSLAVYGDYHAVLPTGNTFTQTLEAGLRLRF